MNEVKDSRSTYLAFDIGGTKIAYGLVTLPESLESSGSSFGKESEDSLLQQWKTMALCQQKLQKAEKT